MTSAVCTITLLVCPELALLFVKLLSLYAKAIWSKMVLPHPITHPNYSISRLFSIPLASPHFSNHNWHAPPPLPLSICLITVMVTQIICALVSYTDLNTTPLMTQTDIGLSVKTPHACFPWDGAKQWRIPRNASECTSGNDFEQSNESALNQAQPEEVLLLLWFSGLNFSWICML